MHLKAANAMRVDITTGMNLLLQLQILRADFVVQVGLCSLDRTE